MDTKELKSNMKRACESDEDQQGKCQRIELSDEPVDKTTKIIDLNDDCLVKIFGHLDLQSLFNVAIANEWLRPATNEVYKRKFRTKKVKIERCDDYRPKTRGNIRDENACKYPPLKEQDDYNVSVCGLKAALQYLRCFGSSIKDLTIYYNQSKSKRYNYVHQYINEYCAQSLVELSFDKMPSFAIKQFETIYANVTKVNCFIECESVHMVHQSDTETFGNLRDVCIYNCNTALKSKSKVNELLRLNHRLTHLVMEVNNGPPLPFDTLLDMIIGKSLITKLVAKTNFIYIIITKPVNSTQVLRLASEHPALDTLDLKSYKFAVADVFTLIRQLNSLNFFCFVIEKSDYKQLKAQLKGSGWIRKKILVFGTEFTSD